MESGSRRAWEEMNASSIQLDMNFVSILGQNGSNMFFINIQMKEDEGGRVAIRAVKAKNRQKVRNDYPDQERKRDGEKERGVLE